MPNIVVVDDQATDRQILARLMHDLAADVEAHAFARPSEALEWLRDNEADLVLVDYRLPEMDGLAFIEALGDIPGCNGVPVVVITIVDDTDLRYRALEKGATDFLNKPLDLHECQARCRNLLTLRRQQLTIERQVERLSESRRRTARALQTLSLTNSLLTTTQSEQDLIYGIVRLVFEQAGYPVVRAGLWDRNDCLHEIARIPARTQQDVTAFSVPALGALAEEVRENSRIKIFNDLADEDEEQCEGAHDLQAAGFLSMVIVPVRIEGNVDGLLAVFSREAGSFDRDEVELLAQIASSLGYGLAAYRTQRARDRAKRDCRYLTHFDRLTGLPNRNRLLERMRESVESNAGGHRTAVLTINLDRFSLVNTTLGHEAGDQVLLQVVRRLQAISREGDLLARQANDEFVLLPSAGEDQQRSPHAPMDYEDAERLARRIIESMHRPVRINGEDYYIGASIGIDQIDPTENDFQAPLRRSGTAMRQAKKAGGNTYTVYNDDLTERHSHRLSLENRLRRAVERGDFTLYYQPIVELDSGHPFGVEALLRWPQDDGSIMLPDTFVPLVEETGLMEPLGDWILHSACAQARAWADEEFTPHISINLSMHQLLRSRVAADIAAIMQEHGVPPERFELEVTETTMMTDPEHTERIVHELHERGIGIALDDFGVGYSSLSRLRQLPITTLKIDKEFVLGLPGDPSEHTIVQSIIQLATNLRMRAVAEGIENRAQQRALGLMGCQFGQGHYFSAPVPPVALRTVMDRLGRQDDPGERRSSGKPP